MSHTKMNTIKVKDIKPRCGRCGKTGRTVLPCSKGIDLCKNCRVATNHWDTEHALSPK